MLTLDARLRRWAVVLTHSHREFIAQETLERRGFEVFEPSFLTTRRHAKVENLRDGSVSALRLHPD